MIQACTGIPLVFGKEMIEQITSAIISNSWRLLKVAGLGNSRRELFTFHRKLTLSYCTMVVRVTFYLVPCLCMFCALYMVFPGSMVFPGYFVVWCGEQCHMTLNSTAWNLLRSPAWIWHVDLSIAEWQSSTSISLSQDWKHLHTEQYYGIRMQQIYLILAEPSSSGLNVSAAAKAFAWAQKPLLHFEYLHFSNMFYFVVMSCFSFHPQTWERNMSSCVASSCCFQRFDLIESISAWVTEPEAKSFLTRYALLKYFRFPIFASLLALTWHVESYYRLTIFWKTCQNPSIDYSMKSRSVIQWTVWKRFHVN